MKFSEVYLIEDIYMQIVAFDCFMFTVFSWCYFFMLIIFMELENILFGCLYKAAFYIAVEP